MMRYYKRLAQPEFTPGEKKWFEKGDKMQPQTEMTEEEVKKAYALQRPNEQVDEPEDEVTKPMVRLEPRKQLAAKEQKKPMTEEERDEALSEGDPVVAKWFKDGRTSDEAPPEEQMGERRRAA